MDANDDMKRYLAILIDASDYKEKRTAKDDRKQETNLSAKKQKLQCYFIPKLILILMPYCTTQHSSMQAKPNIPLSLISLLPHFLTLLTFPNHPTTPLKLNASKNPLRSSFFTSTTSCSKLSMRTLAPVSSTTSPNAVPNLLLP